MFFDKNKSATKFYTENLVALLSNCPNIRFNKCYNLLSTHMIKFDIIWIIDTIIFESRKLI